MYTITEGQRFGRLRVLSATGRWLPCRCDCGAEKAIDKHHLLSGDTRSCGCLNKEKRSERARARGRLIVPGTVFGRWTVLDPMNHAAVYCRCVCGTEKTVHAKSLFRGASTSCGCLQRELVAERRRKQAKPIQPGDRFGQWVVLEAMNRQAVVCRCDCGSERTVEGSNLLQGFSKSCGCQPPCKTHGLSRHPLYRRWYSMVLRCTRSDIKDWKNYGGRGITVYAPWLDVAQYIHDVEAEIGPCPEGLTLDRINNDGNYEPGNIRWATPKEQSNNVRWHGRHKPKGELLP